jgi:predicted transposase YdaD
MEIEPMAQPADTGSKKLISLDPTAWARWVTGLDDVTAGRPWDEEL